MTDENRPVHEHSFAHMPAPSAFCPFKSSASNQYIHLSNIPKDYARGQAIRLSFLKNWIWHFNEIKRFVGYVDIYDFIRRIKLADAENLWACNKISEWEIPYVLMVWKSFEPIIARDGQILRRHWVRLWYDARFRTIEDIWIRQTGDLFIVKAVYDAPVKATTPSAQHIRETLRKPANPQFLDDETPVVNNYQTMSMAKAFPKELGLTQANHQLHSDL